MFLLIYPLSISMFCFIILNKSKNIAFFKKNEIEDFSIKLY